MFKRSLGLEEVRGLATSLPADTRYSCDVKYTFKVFQIGNPELGYIYLYSGYVSSLHQFYYIPNSVDW
jgi:hypothetical protein